MVVGERSSQPLSFQAAMASLIVVRSPQLGRASGLGGGLVAVGVGDEAGQSALGLSLASVEGGVAMPNPAVAVAADVGAELPGVGTTSESHAACHLYTLPAFVGFCVGSTVVGGCGGLRDTL